MAVQRQAAAACATIIAVWTTCLATADRGLIVPGIALMLLAYPPAGLNLVVKLARDSLPTHYTCVPALADVGMSRALRQQQPGGYRCK
jgi:hypothetical protein